MATTAPLIPGRTAIVRIRQSGASYDFTQILVLIRKQSGIPPYRFRNSAPSETEVEYRDVAIYLGHYYPQLDCQDLADYFSIDINHVNAVVGNPFQKCNLEILSHLQGLIEDSLSQKIPVSLASKRILNNCERDAYMETSAPGGEWLVVDELGCCEHELEDMKALFGLRDFYEQRGEHFDPADFWGDVDFDHWGVCEFIPESRDGSRLLPIRSKGCGDEHS